jgi:hypothetical protein
MKSLPKIKTAIRLADLGKTETLKYRVPAMEFTSVLADEIRGVQKVHLVRGATGSILALYLNMRYFPGKE